MSKQTVTVEVEIDFKEGKKTIEMIIKDPYEIEDCEEGKVVILNLINGKIYTGIFKGMDGDEDIMLGSLSGKNTIGLKVGWLNEYLEQVSS